MNFFDRLTAAIMPRETDDDRLRARNNALAMAQDEDWLARAIQHHREIEGLFGQALAAQGAEARRAAAKRLGQLLSAYSMAEEGVLYPAMARTGERADTAMAYEEQAMTKVELAALEEIDPEADEWREKLEAIRDAVAHHVYEEESEWFPRLRNSLSAPDAARITARFDEEFDRHGDMADGHIRASMGSPRINGGIPPIG